MPAYFWQGTGVRKHNDTIVATNVHPDFGWAMVPQTNPGGTNVYLNGVPAAGFTTTAAATFEGINIAGHRADRVRRDSGLGRLPRRQPNLLEPVGGTRPRRDRRRCVQV